MHLPAACLWVEGLEGDCRSQKKGCLFQICTRSLFVDPVAGHQASPTYSSCALTLLP